MEFISALLYYFIFSLFAAVGLPLTARLTSKRALAWGAAKLTGFILFAYIVWVSSYLRFLDYQSYQTLLIIFILFLLAGIGAIWKWSGGIFKGGGLKEIVWIEALSLAVYIFYLFLRSRNPAANGTEHFMDMALLQAAGKTHFFPFIDPWYAGKFVNYYYFGQYLMGLIANLGRISFGLTYNFALALIFTQSAVLSGLLAYVMTGFKKYGLLAAFLVVAAGTLFFSGCVFNGLFSSPVRVCPYPSSTRLYTPSYIINEIPSYSFTVGNLHAHLVALPIFLLDLIFIYFLAQSGAPAILNIILLACGLAASGMANPWDLVSAASVLAAVVVIKTIKNSWKWFTAGGVVLILVLLLMLPNLLNFSSPILGLGFAPSFVRLHHLSGVQYPTPLMAVLGMWGIFLAGAVLVLIYKRKELFADTFLSALLVVSAGILVGTEIFFVADIYSIANPPYFRANTTFKFGYDAWVMLSVVFVSFLAILKGAAPSKKSSGKKIAASALAFLAVVAGAVYSFEAVRQYYAGSGDFELDASRWMAKESPGDMATVEYINNHFEERTVIAEAVGDSYTSYARIATFTGMITPMGWKTHEWTWRLDAKAAKKAPVGAQIETGWGAVAGVALDIERFYKTSDKNEAKGIIDKYGIEYVYVGDLERQTYQGLNEPKFSELGTLIFSAGESALYAIK
ncbi:hypothetical protein HYT01_02640 [Candidatus Giovannonibacteria bacterium]|nr:hypothetical protein [Candidatus Giovannonibacteria bacterium]